MSKSGSNRSITYDRAGKKRTEQCAPGDASERGVFSCELAVRLA